MTKMYTVTYRLGAYGKDETTEICAAGWHQAVEAFKRNTRKIRSLSILNVEVAA